jgi:zinc D-Ala-D-Ala carboxypeptidase
MEYQMQLSKNFTADELECPCGCRMLPKPELVTALQRLRDVYGKPVKINSAARCAVHNVKVGGSPKSKHVEGLAVDIAADSATAYQLAKLGFQLGWGGIGVAKTFVHLDIRPVSEARLWTY